MGRPLPAAERVLHLLLDTGGSWNLRFQPQRGDLSGLNLASAESGNPGVQPKLWAPIGPREKVAPDGAFISPSADGRAGPSPAERLWALSAHSRLRPAGG